MIVSIPSRSARSASSVTPVTSVTSVFAPIIPIVSYSGPHATLASGNAPSMSVSEKSVTCPQATGQL